MSSNESAARYERPKINPFVPHENYSEVAPTLVYAALETIAYAHVPMVAGDRLHPVIADFSLLWAHRITNGGDESYSCAAAWELSVRVAQMEAEGIPIPSWEVSTRCEDPECQVDHATQYEVLNEFLHRSRVHDHKGAVQAFATYNRQEPLEAQPRAFMEGVSVFVTHVARRVSDYRNGLTVELPTL